MTWNNHCSIVHQYNKDGQNRTEQGYKSLHSRVTSPSLFMCSVRARLEDGLTSFAYDTNSGGKCLLSGDTCVRADPDDVDDKPKRIKMSNLIGKTARAGAVFSTVSAFSYEASMTNNICSLFSYPCAVSYLGCYADTAHHFLHHSTGSTLTDLTPWTCFDYCLREEMEFAGMEGVRDSQSTV